MGNVRRVERADESNEGPVLDADERYTADEKEGAKGIVNGHDLRCRQLHNDSFTEDLLSFACILLRRRQGLELRSIQSFTCIISPAYY